MRSIAVARLWAAFGRPEASDGDSDGPSTHLHTSTSRSNAPRASTLLHPPDASQPLRLHADPASGNQFRSHHPETLASNAITAPSIDTRCQPRYRTCSNASNHQPQRVNFHTSPNASTFLSFKRAHPVPTTEQQDAFSVPNTNAP